MKNLSRIIIAILSIAIAGYAFQFLDFKVKGILFDKGELTQSLPYLLTFYTHTTLGGLALVLGSFQFFPKLRNKYLKIHRLLGKTYVAACLLSGTAGFLIAFFANGGWSNKLGFSLLAIAWLFTTWQAYAFIRKGEVELHRKWMVRSFAVTLAAVTLRLYLPLLIMSGLSFPQAYAVVSWMCWIPNLLVAEWLLHREAAQLTTG